MEQGLCFKNIVELMNEEMYDTQILKRLETIARAQGNKLSELDNLNETNYPTLDDFLSAREEIRDTVKKTIEADFEDFLE